MASGSTKPAEDESRLLFTTEVFLANIPSIVSDLSSAKYALLIFSDKSRNEVKQKNSLIPALSDAYRELVEVRGTLRKEQQKLNELETQLVRSSPPKFLSIEEIHPKGTESTLPVRDCRSSDTVDAKEESLSKEVLQNSSPVATQATMSTSPGMVSNHEMGNGATPTTTDLSSHTVLVLNADDMKRVRESESLLEEEREELMALAKETNEMENQIEEDRVRCEEMSRHVHSLRYKYEAVLTELMAAKIERRKYVILQEEWHGRAEIVKTSQVEMDKIISLCRSEELGIIADAVKAAHERVSRFRKKMEEKKHSNEVELAVYQIAYKEQQAAADELKDAAIRLKHHQWELELIAKRQEIEKLKRNSIRRLLMSSLSMSPEKRETGTQELTEEHLNEVKEDHRMVSALAARVGVMEARREALAAELLRISPSEKDTTRMECALRRMRDILEEEITIEESTMLQDDEDLTSLYNKGV